MAPRSEEDGEPQIRPVQSEIVHGEVPPYEPVDEAVEAWARMRKLVVLGRRVFCTSCAKEQLKEERTAGPIQQEEVSMLCGHPEIDWTWTELDQVAELEAPKTWPLASVDVVVAALRTSR